MTVALILLALLLGVGVLLWLHDRMTRPDADKQSPAQQQQPEECCGMHITCKRDSLLASVSPQIEYYDDEELDAFKDYDPEEYTDVEIELFRDVLLTMRPDDIAGWARSLQLRNVPLPPVVRDELLMIVAEARSQHSVHNV